MLVQACTCSHGTAADDVCSSTDDSCISCDDGYILTDGACTPPPAVDSITSDAATYFPGASITFTFDRAGAGARDSWIGIYRRESDPTSTAYLAWLRPCGGYSFCSTAWTAGSVTFTNAELGRVQAVGEYSAYYYTNNGYIPLAGVDFAIGDLHICFIRVLFTLSFL